MVALKQYVVEGHTHLLKFLNPAEEAGAISAADIMNMDCRSDGEPR